MPANDSYEFSLILDCCVLVIVTIASLVYCTRFAGIPRGKGFLLWLAALLLAVVAGVLRGINIKHETAFFGHMPLERNILPLVLYTASFVMAAVPFAFKLYLKLVAGQLSPGEKVSRAEGVRAWLGGGNLILAVAVAVLAWAAFGYPVIINLAATVALLVVYPLLNTSQDTPRPAETEDLTADRERILQMLAEGKITADDSAELLNALGASARHRSSPPPTPGRKLVLVGAALVLLGFFLPWFSFNMQEELQHQASQLGIALPSFPGMQSQGMHSSSFAISGGGMLPFGSSEMPGSSNINIAGGDIVHGLGWLVLVLAVGVAALPYIAPGMDRHTQRTLTLLALGIGAVVLAYLLSQFLRAVAIGLVFAACGYFCAIIGELKETRPPAAA